MRLSSVPLKSKYQTVDEVKHAVDTYYTDLTAFPDLTKMNVVQFFEYVKNIPYVRDMKESEVVSRPKYLLTMFPALDCKKKSILFGSYMRLKYGPYSYRYVISSNRPDGAIGHIFTQVCSKGKWLNADCTYSHNKMAEPKKVTNYEIMGG